MSIRPENVARGATEGKSWSPHLEVLRLTRQRPWSASNRDPSQGRQFKRSVALVAAALVLLASCTSARRSPSNSGTSAQPLVSSVPTPLTARGLTLPIEAYLLSDDDNEFRLVDDALTVLTNECMKRFGFVYEPPPSPIGFQEGFMDLRYGLIDGERASKFGYHGAPAGGVGRVRRPTPDRVWLLVLTGGEQAVAASPAPGSTSGLSHNGVSIPPGGCLGEATARLEKDGGTYSDADIAREINHGSYGRSLEHPRVRAVFAEWSKCMSAKGYKYATPLTANDDPAFGGPTPSAREIATAVADVACKREANVVGVWYAVEVALQTQAIEQHAEELAEIKRGIGEMLRNAAAVVADSGAEGGR